MRQTTIIKKVLDKAIKNGFNFSFIDGGLSPVIDFKIINKHNIEVCDMFFNPYEIIFNHDFAKSFWGYKRVFCISSYGCLEDQDDDRDDPQYDGKAENDLSLSRRIEAYKYHLQQMVILNDKERISYLEKFL
jgi:hypothetical protein